MMTGDTLWRWHWDKKQWVMSCFSSSDFVNDIGKRADYAFKPFNFEDTKEFKPKDFSND